MDQSTRQLVAVANRTGKMHISTVVNAIKTDEPTFWEFFANNNPAAILGLYMKAGSKNMPTHPHMDAIYPIFKKLLDLRNYKELGYLLANTPYNTQANNITTNANIWQLLGVAQGDYITLYKTYFPQQYALTTLTR